MQLFCFGLCGSVGLVGVKVALYAQSEPKKFPFTYGGISSYAMVMRLMPSYAMVVRRMPLSVAQVKS
jgi:hypothetical protein